MKYITLMKRYKGRGSLLNVDHGPPDAKAHGDNLHQHQ